MSKTILSDWEVTRIGPSRHVLVEHRGSVAQAAVFKDRDLTSERKMARQRWRHVTGVITAGRGQLDSDVWIGLVVAGAILGLESVPVADPRDKHPAVGAGLFGVPCFATPRAAELSPVRMTWAGARDTRLCTRMSLVRNTRRPLGRAARNSSQGGSHHATHPPALRTARGHGYRLPRSPPTSA